MSGSVVALSEKGPKKNLKDLGRQTIEEMMDGHLREADDAVGTERCERSAGRKAYRAGHYNRGFATSCSWILKSRHAKVTMILKATHVMKSLVT